MRIIFADTGYWLATIHPRDGLHRAAREILPRLGEYRIITSDMVLVEVLNAVSAQGSHPRKDAAVLVEQIIDPPDIEIVPQTPELFRAAFALYRERPDKNWSLTDCASFLIMDERKITEALTHDGHFEQKGYRALLRG